MRKAEVHLNILFQIRMGLGWSGLGWVHRLAGLAALVPYMKGLIYFLGEMSYIKISIFSSYITRQKQKQKNQSSPIAYNEEI